MFSFVFHFSPSFMIKNKKNVVLKGALQQINKQIKEAEEKVAAITLDEDGNPNGTVEMDGL